MRLALAALVFAAPAALSAADRRCMAHVHRGAVPWDVDFDTGIASPAEIPKRGRRPAPGAVEVASVRRDAKGQLWVERSYDFTWRHSDVDMRGDCRTAYWD